MTGYPVTKEERKKLHEDALAVQRRFFTKGALKRIRRRRRCWWCGR